MKNKTLDYTLVLKLVIPLMLLLLLASYQLAFKRTWESYRTYTLLKEQGLGTDRLSVSPVYTLARIKKVDELYRRFRVDTLAWKNTLWNSAAGLAQKYACTINAYPPVKTVLYNQQQFYRQAMGFNGEFGNLQQLLHELSYLKNIGMLSGITYVKKPREKQLLLNVELLALPDKD
ncbi:hypothetical protein HDC92_004652 [Pedobacter sp. AK017]|uniref:hypothetical protein n=1 Tax=Pedobacter sp. AK017 TaxID=2723073 RepID=UPI001620D2E5|nr:hypothetical protein [Pedobacter sp. AK017]MBB5440948.1 hypothetical protein [Pedobacter sp. AK017]